MAYVHITSAGANAVSFSICAKCGSTSLFHSLFKAVYGTTYDEINKIRNTNPKGWVQQWWKWPESGRPDGSLLMYAGHLQTYPGITWMHFHVYRDPVDRYISSYFSKLRCCGDLPWEVLNPQNRTICASDSSGFHYVGPSLTDATGTADVPPCFYFEEYANLLDTARRLNASYGLDEHIRPQYLPRGRFHRMVSAGTISDVVISIKDLTGLGLRKIEGYLGHDHRTKNKASFKPSPAALKVLCSASLPEYTWFKLPMSPQCAGAGNSLRSAERHRV